METAGTDLETEAGSFGHFMLVLPHSSSPALLRLPPSARDTETLVVSVRIAGLRPGGSASDGQPFPHTGPMNE